MRLNESYTIPNWPAPTQIKSLSTMRNGGVSQSPFNTLNLGNHVNDDKKSVFYNRQLIQDQLPTNSQPLWLNQTHSSIAIDANTYVDNIEADAIFSTRTSQCLVIMTADCLPILLCSENGAKIAAIHAGWKSLSAGIIQNTLNKLAIKNEKYLAWLGPCISQKFFEVGSEVKQKFSSIDSNYQQGFIFKKNTQKYYACLKTLASNQLKTFGNIEVYLSNECTYENSNDFFSYRRDGITGRMATFIWMENNL